MIPGNTVMSKVRLNNVPVKECNETYSSELDLGILPDSMVCAGTITNGEDACWVDIEHVNFFTKHTYFLPYDVDIPCTSL